MSFRHRRPLHVTKGQAEYLQELLTDDLAETDLTSEEIDKAKGILGRVEYLLDGWSTPPVNDFGEDPEGDFVT